MPGRSYLFFFSFEISNLRRGTLNYVNIPFLTNFQFVHLFIIICVDTASGYSMGYSGFSVANNIDSIAQSFPVWLVPFL